MDIQDLDFSYPLELIATEVKKDFKILFTKVNLKKPFQEISKIELLNQFQPNDVLVINNTKVIKRRIFSNTEPKIEILFVKKITEKPISVTNNNLKSTNNLETWEVLLPSKKMQIKDTLHLPGNVTLQLIKKSIPQLVEVNKTLNVEYFQKYGEMPLPPYIQKARDNRKNNKTDELHYQTAWAKHWGSCAAPTASLHFTQSDLEYLKEKRKVKIVELTLHVGLGTFLPIKVKNVLEHKMHKEYMHISASSLKDIVSAKKENAKIWALGTTVTRALETWFLEKGKTAVLDTKEDFKDFITESELFITPGFSFKVVDVLMTNFHQPQSTLLAMLMAFAGKFKVLEGYKWAIKRQFRLFSYGDLSIWDKEKNE
ncbi:MAG: S-adenosylmethionine:tRNA ribosyltransferase-isomerase [Bdellovibrionaceae bacterium]|nr:S-adenosylmethionine:tRNA ribosyltransferase-isomerase [Pseudobdellovibrionaceae bacterium]